MPPVLVPPQRPESWRKFGTGSALRFFFDVTLDRADIIRHLPFAREPRKAPIVLSPEEVARMLEAAPGLTSETLGADRRRMSGRPRNLPIIHGAGALPQTDAVCQNPTSRQ